MTKRVLDENDKLRLGILPKHPEDGAVPFRVGKVLPNGRRVDTDAATPAAPPADTDDEEPRPRSKRRKKKSDDEDASKFVRLVELADRWPTFRSPTGRVFAEIEGRSHAVDGEAFAARLTRDAFDASRESISDGAMKSLIRLIGARCTRKEDACIRVAQRGDAWWLDLAADDSSAIRISPGEAVLEKRAPIAFLRTMGTQPLPLPVFPEDAEAATRAIRQALAAVGVTTNRVAVSIFTWWTSALRPHAPYAHLLVRGPQGSGKTMVAVFAARMVDDHRPVLQRLPKVDDLPILAEGAHVLGFDNVSAISQPESDALCCLATGDAMQRRALYTNRDLAVFEAARPVVLTSVVDAATAGDLLDRSLVVTLGVRTSRSTPEEMGERFDGAKAEGLGALAWIVAQARLTAASVTPPTSIRLRPVAALAAAGELLAGFPEGAVFATFAATKSDAVDVASAEPIAAPLVALVRRGGDRWEGTTDELAVDLREQAGPGAALPKTPHAMRSALARLEPELPGLGLHLDRRRTNTRRELILTYRVPCTELGPLEGWLEETFEP